MFVPIITFFVPVLLLALTTGGIITWIATGKKDDSITIPTTFPKTTSLSVTTTTKKILARVCKTEACLKIDENLSSKVNMDGKNKACDNFYLFACGQVESNKSSHQDVEAYLPRMLIKTRFLNILQEPILSKDLKHLKLAKHTYNLCMNGDSDSSGLFKLINYTRGNEKNFTLDVFYKKSVEMGYLPRSLFVIDIIEHPFNRKKKIITIDTPCVECKYYSWPLDTSKINLANFRTINWLRDQFCMKISNSGVGIVCDQDINFDDQLAKEKEIENTHDSSVHEPGILKLSELQSRSKGIPWQEILQGVFEPVKITLGQEILVKCPQCLEKLSNTFVTKNQKVLAEYLRRHLIADNILDVNKDILDDWLMNFDRNTEEPYTSRNLYCTSKAVALFGKIIDYEYTLRHLDRRMQSELNRLIKQVKATFRDVLNKAKYLDSQTRKKSLEKLAAMRIYTAYDDEIIYSDKLDEYYAEFELDPKSFFNSLIKIRSKLIKNTIRTFNDDNERPIKTSDYMIREEELHYDASLNAIFISAGGLGEVLFSRDRPDYLNYATLGSILGHEIAHGFILTGRDYDENGLRINWWKKEAALEQEKRAQCFANHYKKYQGEINAEHMINEILPDNVGVMIAYNAYLTRPKTDFEDKNLPSFNKRYSKTQMFWIAYADMMCTKKKRSRKIQSHPHPSVRINGVVENSKQFARDFKCSRESRMNPPKKCSVW